MTFGSKLPDQTYIEREGVYGLIKKDGQYGVAAVRDTHFFVGGGVDEGEDHQTCLKREFIEEIGWTIEIHEYLGGFKEFDQSFRSKKYYALHAHVYRVTLKEKVSDGEEDHKLVWLNKDGIDEAMALKYQAYVIKKF